MAIKLRHAYLTLSGIFETATDHIGFSGRMSAKPSTMEKLETIIDKYHLNKSEISQKLDNLPQPGFLDRTEYGASKLILNDSLLKKMDSSDIETVKEQVNQVMYADLNAAGNVHESIRIDGLSYSKFKDIVPDATQFTQFAYHGGTGMHSETLTYATNEETIEIGRVKKGDKSEYQFQKGHIGPVIVGTRDEVMAQVQGAGKYIDMLEAVSERLHKQLPKYFKDNTVHSPVGVSNK